MLPNQGTPSWSESSRAFTQPSYHASYIPCQCTLHLMWNYHKLSSIGTISKNQQSTCRKTRSKSTSSVDILSVILIWTCSPHHPIQLNTESSHKWEPFSMTLHIQHKFSLLHQPVWLIAYENNSKYSSWLSPHNELQLCRGPKSMDTVCGYIHYSNYYIDYCPVTLQRWDGLWLIWVPSIRPWIIWIYAPIVFNTSNCWDLAMMTPKHLLCHDIVARWALCEEVGKFSNRKAWQDSSIELIEHVWNLPGVRNCSAVKWDLWKRDRT